MNTLIDVHGKMGNWEEAVRVLDVMKQEVRLAKVSGLPGCILGLATKSPWAMCFAGAMSGLP